MIPQALRVLPRACRGRVGRWRNFACVSVQKRLSVVGCHSGPEVAGAEARVLPASRAGRVERFARAR
jgi:hypothetical protein